MPTPGQDQPGSEPGEGPSSHRSIRGHALHPGAHDSFAGSNRKRAGISLSGYKVAPPPPSGDVATRRTRWPLVVYHVKHRVNLKRRIVRAIHDAFVRARERSTQGITRMRVMAKYTGPGTEEVDPLRRTIDLSYDFQVGRRTAASHRAAAVRQSTAIALQNDVLTQAFLGWAQAARDRMRLRAERRAAKQASRVLTKPPQERTNQDIHILEKYVSASSSRLVGADKELLGALLRCAYVVVCEPGTVIIQQNTVARSCYFVISGTCTVHDESAPTESRATTPGGRTHSRTGTRNGPVGHVPGMAAHAGASAPHGASGSNHAGGADASKAMPGAGRRGAAHPSHAHPHPQGSVHFAGTSGEEAKGKERHGAWQGGKGDVGEGQMEEEEDPDGDIGIVTKHGKMLKRLRVTDCFGELSISKEDSLRQATVVAETETVLMAIDRQDYRFCLQEKEEALQRSRLDMLCRSSVFRNCGIQKLRDALNHMTTAEHPGNSVILKQGEEPSDIFFVLSGVAKMIYHLATDKGSTVRLFLGDVGPEEYIGDYALLHKCPHVYSIVSTGAVSLLRLAKEELFGRMDASVLRHLQSASMWHPTKDTIIAAFQAKCTWYKYRNDVVEVAVPDPNVGPLAPCHGTPTKPTTSPEPFQQQRALPPPPHASQSLQDLDPGGGLTAHEQKVKRLQTRREGLTRRGMAALVTIQRETAEGSLKKELASLSPLTSPTGRVTAASPKSPRSPSSPNGLALTKSSFEQLQALLPAASRTSVLVGTGGGGADGKEAAGGSMGLLVDEPEDERFKEQVLWHADYDLHQDLAFKKRSYVEYVEGASVAILELVISDQRTEHLHTERERARRGMWNPLASRLLDMACLGRIQDAWRHSTQSVEAGISVSYCNHTTCVLFSWEVTATVEGNARVLSKLVREMAEAIVNEQATYKTGVGLLGTMTTGSFFVTFHSVQSARTLQHIYGKPMDTAWTLHYSRPRKLNDVYLTPELARLLHPTFHLTTKDWPTEVIPYYVPVDSVAGSAVPVLPEPIPEGGAAASQGNNPSGLHPGGGGLSSGGPSPVPSQAHPDVGGTSPLASAPQVPRLGYSKTLSRSSSYNQFANGSVGDNRSAMSVAVALQRHSSVVSRSGGKAVNHADVRGGARPDDEVIDHRGDEDSDPWETSSSSSGSSRHDGADEEDEDDDAAAREREEDLRRLIEARTRAELRKVMTMQGGDASKSRRFVPADVPVAKSGSGTPNAPHASPGTCEHPGSKPNLAQHAGVLKPAQSIGGRHPTNAAAGTTTEDKQGSHGEALTACVPGEGASSPVATSPPSGSVGGSATHAYASTAADRSTAVHVNKSDGILSAGNDAGNNASKTVGNNAGKYDGKDADNSASGIVSSRSRGSPGDGSNKPGEIRGPDGAPISAPGALLATPTARLSSSPTTSLPPASLLGPRGDMVPVLVGGSIMFKKQASGSQIAGPDNNNNYNAAVSTSSSASPSQDGAAQPGQQAADASGISEGPNGAAPPGWRVSGFDKNASFASRLSDGSRLSENGAKGGPAGAPAGPLLTKYGMLAGKGAGADAVTSVDPLSGNVFILGAAKPDELSSLSRIEVQKDLASIMDMKRGDPALLLARKGSAGLGDMRIAQGSPLNGPELGLLVATSGPPGAAARSSARLPGTPLSPPDRLLLGGGPLSPPHERQQLLLSPVGRHRGEGPLASLGQQRARWRADLLDRRSHTTLGFYHDSEGGGRRVTDGGGGGRETWEEKIRCWMR
eukprot:jgi/Mesvir1/950/Mv17504-RA.1